jgi:hypothetical protein
MIGTDAGDAAYEAHMTKADGSRVTLKFDKSLAIIKVATNIGQGDPHLRGQPGGSAGAPPGIAPSASTSGSVGGSFTGMTRTVALLRGVNVGGRNRLPMADLRQVLEGLGYGDVCTILQSGNALFEASARELRSAATDIERALGDELGLNIRVVTRSATELAAAVAADPLQAVATDPAKHFIGFLRVSGNRARKRSGRCDRGACLLVVPFRALEVAAVQVRLGPTFRDLGDAAERQDDRQDPGPALNSRHSRSSPAGHRSLS